MRKRLGWGGLSAVAFVSAACATEEKQPALVPVPVPVPVVVLDEPIEVSSEPESAPPTVSSSPKVFESARRILNDTLGGLLNKAQLGVQEQVAVVQALAHKVDPRRMRANDLVTIRSEAGIFRGLSVQRLGEDGVPETVILEKDDEGKMSVRAESAEVRVVTETISGTVTGTLYDSMMALREQPALINHFVESFGSAVDFYREVQNGDGFRVVVQKRYAGERFIGYGRLLAVEYAQSRRAIRAFHHQLKDGSAGYYDEKGRSLQTGMLRTPMEFTRITSRFGMRFHPILKERKAHNGIDYGAPTGTPVWSMGDGRVLSAGYEGPCGNAVQIQHVNGLVTGYCHLSKFAAGLKAGTRVSQKQVVGYVGTTGRSTAPHLHLFMKQHGNFVNPQRIDMPRKPGLAGAELEKFRKETAPLASALDATPTA